jgi:hypothetical protein
MSRRWGSTPRQIDWLTVGCNVTFTLTIFIGYKLAGFQLGLIHWICKTDFRHLGYFYWNKGDRLSKSGVLDLNLLGKLRACQPTKFRHLWKPKLISYFMKPLSHFDTMHTFFYPIKSSFSSLHFILLRLFLLLILLCLPALVFLFLVSFSVSPFVIFFLYLLLSFSLQISTSIFSCFLNLL